MQRTILTVFVCFCVAYSYAQPDGSTNYRVTLPDTLQAYINGDQQSFLYFYAQNAWALSEIASLFALDTKGMIKLGRTHEQGINGIVLLPFAKSKLVTCPSPRNNWIPVVYVVRRKETIFKIARRYFDLKVDELLTINNRQSTKLSIGQRLIVGWIRVEGSLPPSEPARSEVLVTADETVIPYINRYGVAEWNKELHLSDDGYYVMHRSARINSQMELTNPMFNTRVQAKVIGRIPATYRQNINVVVSPAVARDLHILDPRFRVHMRFVE